MDLQLGRTQVDAGPRALDHEGPEIPVQLDRRQRIRLERAPRRDAERREPPSLDDRGHRRLHGLHGRRYPGGQCRAGHAAHVRHASENGVRPLVALEIEQDPAGELLNADGPEVAGGPLQIPEQMAEEERPVAALEADLVIVNDQG
jgi:hypothetical protein